MTLNFSSFSKAKVQNVNEHRTKTIAFVCAKKELGTSIAYLKTLYALKEIYKCRLIVFGNSLSKNLYEQCKFIDEHLDIGECNHHLKSTQTKMQVATINSYCCDYLIAPDAKSTFLQFCLATNAKHIICALKFVSLFSLRTKTIPIYAKKVFKNMSYETKLLYFARKINPKLFDKYIPTLDFSKIQLCASSIATQKVQAFFANTLTSYKLESNILDSTPPQQVENSTSRKRLFLVMINPFNINNSHTLPQNAWLDLIAKFSAISYFKVLIATYPKVHRDFMQALLSYDPSLKVLIFQNNNDLQNLIALTKMVHCLISPSTGTTHLAINLKIPTIGLYAEYDKNQWGHRDIHYISIPAPANMLTQEQCENIITQSLQKAIAIYQSYSNLS